MEPLLDVVARNSSTIACPVIDTIHDDTFEYMVRFLLALAAGKPLQLTFQISWLLQHKPAERGISWVGGLTWALTFTWHLLPPRLRWTISYLSRSEAKVLPGLPHPPPPSPPPPWPEVSSQFPATSSSSWAATTPALTSGAERTLSSASRRGCVPEAFSSFPAVTSATFSGEYVLELLI